MMSYTVDKMKDIYTVLDELASSSDSDLNVFIPEGALLLQNKLNIQFLSENLEKLDKTVRFETSDPNGVELLINLEASSEAGFEGSYSSNNVLRNSGSPKAFFGFFHKIKFPRLSLPRPKFKIGLLVLLLVIFGGVAYGINRYISKQVAEIEISLKADSLARSITVRVEDEISPSSNDSSKKTLKGKTVNAVLEEQAEVVTTGEKYIGEKADGKILIYNRKASDITLKSGTEAYYGSGDEKLTYVLKDSVTVSGFTYEEPEDPASVMIPGEASISVEASEIGDDYNISSNKTLTFKDYDKTELVAKSSEKFTGGSKKAVKIVSEEDLTPLEGEVNAKISSKVEEAVKRAVPSGSTLVEGSTATTYTASEYSAKVDDEADKVSLKKTATVSALTYSPKDLEKLMVSSLDSYIPDGYTISGSNHTVKAEVLGRSETSVLSDAQADLQVTVKTSVVLDIDVEDLKNRIKGLSPEELHEEMRKIQGVQDYEFNLSPTIPFLKQVPRNPDKIVISINGES